MLNVPKLGGRPVTVEPAPAAAPIEAPEADFDLYTLALSRPLRTHKGEVRTLVIREPTAADYIEIGRVPFDVRGENEDRRAQIDHKCAGEWVARLTDLDEIVIGGMASRDWLAMVGRINAILMNAGIDAMGN